MDERVRAILEQTTTKTHKIQQLLLLGLTRREIADLVTNGNCGFVFNVYKKMLDNGTFVTPQNPVTLTPVLDYTFTHKFGVEIEAYNCTMAKLSRELRDAGIRISVEGYNHTTQDHWKLVTDGSLHGENTFELVSPILSGKPDCRNLRPCVGYSTCVMSK